MEPIRIAWCVPHRAPSGEYENCLWDDYLGSRQTRPDEPCKFMDVMVTPVVKP